MCHRINDTASYNVFSDTPYLYSESLVRILVQKMDLLPRGIKLFLLSPSLAL
jgi:hypothetical protein